MQSESETTIDSTSAQENFGVLVVKQLRGFIN